MIKDYNRQNSVEYAQKWALGRNPSYYKFDNIGGDCTNYISQCLLAGGGVMNHDKYYGWYYVSLSDRSPSWTGVVYLNDFLLNNKTRGPFGVESSISNLQLGDIIQLKQSERDFNHSLIVTKITNQNIYVCAHDGNSLDRPLSSYGYIYLRGIHIKGIYV